MHTGQSKAYKEKWIKAYRKVWVLLNGHGYEGLDYKGFLAAVLLELEEQKRNLKARRVLSPDERGDYPKIDLTDHYSALDKH